MKQKTVKQPLTAAEVTANLHRLFGRTDCQCTDVFQVDVWGDKYTHFALSFPNINLIVDGHKQVWEASPRDMKSYEEHGHYYGNMVVKEINGQVCIPYNYVKSKELKADADKVLIACGLKKEVNGDDDIKRLKKLAGMQYVNIYKMLQGVTILSAKMGTETCEGRWGRVEEVDHVLNVQYEGGGCRIKLDRVAQYEEDNVEIRNIFCSLVGLPISSQVEMQEAA